MVKRATLSDPICPWCYIGKSYPDRALEASEIIHLSLNGTRSS